MQMLGIFPTPKVRSEMSFRIWKLPMRWEARIKLEKVRKSRSFRPGGPGSTKTLQNIVRKVLFRNIVIHFAGSAVTFQVVLGWVVNRSFCFFAFCNRGFRYTTQWYGGVWACCRTHPRFNQSAFHGLCHDVGSWWLLVCHWTVLTLLVLGFHIRCTSWYLKALKLILDN